MSRSTVLTTLYCTDEDVFTVIPADFATLCPKASRYAGGADGVVSGWTLTSASVNFATRGVLPGMVVQLTGPRSAYNPPDALAVDTVSTNTLTLRRCGMNTNEGDPPVPATAVSFVVLSVRAQIENGSFEANESYSIDPNITYRTPPDVYDPRVLRRLTILWVASQLYLNENRTKDGDFATKAALYRIQYEDALAKAILRWGPVGTTQPTTTKFSTRLGR